MMRSEAATENMEKELPFGNRKYAKAVAMQLKMQKSSCHATENAKKQLPSGNRKYAKGVAL